MVDIFDVNGVMLSHIVTSQNMPIDISKITSGVYFVSISNMEKSFNVIKKLIKIE
ncbi:MAG: T9SS type A sorting domain-containing protein [Chitinophagales bacterium]